MKMSPFQKQIMKKIVAAGRDGYTSVSTTSLNAMEKHGWVNSGVLPDSILSLAWTATAAGISAMEN